MLSFVLILSLIERLVTITVPQIVWWDGAIYVGMGKTIYSNGVVGLWESFRPVVWPGILGFFWKIGLDAYFVGIVIVLISSLASVYLAYKIGEKIRAGSGIYAALIFGFTPTLVIFTPVPLTDIPSLCLGLLALYLLINGSYFLSGLFLSVSFLLRFPQALLFISFLIGLAAAFYYNRKPRPILMFIVGFIPLTLAYFILSYFLYHDPLYTIRVGNTVASNSVGPFDNRPFFYIANIIVQNPLYILFFVFIYAWFKKGKELIKNPAALITLISIFLLGAYFTLFPHKEPRYALAFMPYLALGAGYGISYLVDSARHKYVYYGVMIFSLLLSLIAPLYVGTYYWLHPSIPKEQYAFYTYFSNKPNVRIITSSPQMIVYSDIKILGMDDTWEGMADRYKTYPTADYIALDGCNLICQATDLQECQKAKGALLKSVSSTHSVVFEESFDSCSYRIYKLTR